MPGFGATPEDGSPTPIPMSSAVSPGDTTPHALEGGPEITDANNNILVPVAEYTPDGNDVDEGKTTDTAVIGDLPGTNSAKLRGLSKLFASVWDSTFGRLFVADIEQAGYIALSGTPPPNTNVATDTALAFVQQVNRVICQNNSPQVAYLDFDQAASTASWAIQPGTLLSYPKKCSNPHVYTVTAIPLNAANGIILRGAM